MNIDEENDNGAAEEGQEGSDSKAQEKQEDDSGKTEFDSSAFIEGGGNAQDNNDSDNDGGDGDDDSDSDNDSNDDSNDDSDDSDSDDNSFAWDAVDSDDDDDSGKDSDEDDSDKSGDGKDSDEGDDSDSNKDNDDSGSSKFTGELTQEHYDAFAKELGLTSGSVDDLKNQMKDLEDENKRLKSGQGATNEKITKYQDLLKYEDEQLYKEDLIAQGFSEEDAQQAADTHKDNGTLKIEATKLRNAINRAINGERSKMTVDQTAEQAKLDNERNEAVADLNKHLSSRDEMFGFKMSSDESKLDGVRADHHKYITSGDFMRDITKDEESLADAAWLWRHRNKMLKALQNNGVQQGRKEILDDLHNPDVSGSKRHKDPVSGSGEFNAAKFTS